MLDVPTARRSITILMADDDEDDRVLTADALRQSRLINDLRFVVDGEDLMHYLRGQGAYADGGIPAPRPGPILLDLNMPRRTAGRHWARSRPIPICAGSPSWSSPPRGPKRTSCAPMTSA